MKKYVFKDRAVENAFRLIAKALDIENFDEQFKESLDNKLPYISFYIGKEEKPVFSFSANLLECIEVYDPNGWNDAYVLPPEDPGLKWRSANLIIEDAFGLLHFGFYHFDSRRWRDVRAGIDITCKRYCLSPSD